MPKSQWVRIFAPVCDLFIVVYFIFALVVLPIRPDLVVPVLLFGFLLCMGADIATTKDPKAAVRQPMRWLRSAYLNLVVVGAIMLGWRYFDEGYDVVTIGLIIVGIFIGEFLLKLQVFSLFSRMGDD